MDPWQVEDDYDGSVGFGSGPPPFSSTTVDAPPVHAVDDIFGAETSLPSVNIGGGGLSIADIPMPPPEDDEIPMSNVDLSVPPPPEDDAPPGYADSHAFVTTSVSVDSSIPSTSIKVAPPPSGQLEEPSEVDVSDAFNISITGTNVSGEGVSSFVTYAVAGTTSLEFYTNAQFSVDRRFSDFVWLHLQLQKSHRAIVIPPLPEKEGISGALSGGRHSDALIAYRRRELEKFLVRVTSHPTLASSKPVQLFLETANSSELITQIQPPASSPSPSKGIMGLFGRGMQSVGLATTTHPATEIDEWFQNKSTYVAQLKADLESVARHALALVGKFTERAPLAKSFQDSCARVSSCEEGNSPSLAAAFEGLAYVSAQSPDLFLEASRSAESDFLHPIKNYVRLISAVQKVLDYRLEKLGEYQTATRALEGKKSKGESEEGAQQKVAETKEMFENVSEIVRSEIHRFEQSKSEEIKQAIADFVQTNINLEIRLLDMWKHLLNRLQDS